MKQQNFIQEEKQANQKLQTEKQAIEDLNVHGDLLDEFNSMLIKVFEDMTGTPEQKKKKLINRLQKFFPCESRINVKDGYFCKRREPVYKHYEKNKKEKEIKLIGN